MVPDPPARPQLLQGFPPCTWALSAWQGASAAAHWVPTTPRNLWEMRARGNPLGAAQAEHGVILVWDRMSSCCTSSGEMQVPAACPSGSATAAGHSYAFLISALRQRERAPMGQRTISAAGHPSSPISRPRHLWATLPTLAVPLLLELITVIIPGLLSSSSLLLSLPCPFICKSNHSVDFFFF